MDLESKREVATADAKLFAEQNDFEFQETSAALNQGMDELVFKLDHKEMRRMPEKVERPVEAKLNPRQEITCLLLSLIVQEYNTII